MDHSLSTLPTTVLFAKAYGIYFTGVGLGLLANPGQFRDWYESLIQESRRVLFGGTIALLIGSFILATHNVLVADWPIIITLIGYWGVITGTGSLITGNFVSFFKPMIHSGDIVYRLSGLGWVIIGLFLAMKGFA